MFEDRTLDKWFATEMQALNRGLVTSGKRLDDVLAEATPTVRARDGTDHVFDVDALRRFAAALPILPRVTVKVPITFWCEHGVSGDCYVREAPAQDALVEGGFVRSTPREGRLWLAESLARDLARRFPTVFQFVLA